MQEITGINNINIYRQTVSTDIRNMPGNPDTLPMPVDSAGISHLPGDENKAQKDTTFLFYLDSQNAMPNEYSLKVLQKLAEAGSGAETGIAVQIGCSSPDEDVDLCVDDEGLLGSVQLPEWGGVRRYEISPDKQANIIETLPDDLKMKEGKNLEDFIAWGMQKYNAEHYVVVIFEHGHAWEGISDKTSAQVAEHISNGVKRANIATGDNDRIDLLFLQSCLMGNTEALSSISRTADVVAGSENTIYAISCRDLDRLVRGHYENNAQGQKEFDPGRLATRFVEHFKELNSDNVEKLNEFRKDQEYDTLLNTSPVSIKREKLLRKMLSEADDTRKAEIFNVLDEDLAHGFETLAVFKSDKMEGLVDSISDFTAVCRKHRIPNGHLYNAIKNSKSLSQNSTDQIYDLGGILKNLANTDGLHPDIKSAVEKALISYRQTIIAEQHDPNRFEGATGLSIWAPVNAIDILMYKGEYEKKAGDFARKTGWLDLMAQGMDNMPSTAVETLDGIKPIIEETVLLLEKLNDPELSAEEKKRLAKIIVNNKKEIYALAPQMDLSGY